MQPKKRPEKKPRAKRTRKGKTPQQLHNATITMISELWNMAEHSSGGVNMKPVEMARIKGIKERLVDRREPWTPADYMNVREVYLRYFGRKA